MALSVSGSIGSKNTEDVASDIAAFRRSLSSMSAATSEPTDVEEAEEEKDLWAAVYKGDITQRHLQEISHDLGLIQLCWENVELGFENRTNFPESYWQNTNKEKLLLWYADNLRQQFQYRFPKRRPILLACNNECGVQKMVCTIIRPTSLRYATMQSCQGCASFVADYIHYVPLVNPAQLPDQLVSPKELLLRQVGHCFEMATLLASLLIGASYQAFVVSGYATREICVNDTTRTECHYLLPEEEVSENTDSRPPSKYQLEPPRDLRSQFLLSQQEKEKAREAAARMAQFKAEERAIMEFEKPSADPLWTHRRHAWVLVLPSKDVKEAMFLEPASGACRKTDDPEYHGIDCVWNHTNYWVAVGEDRLVPCQNLRFELDDLSCWEHLLLGEPASSLQSSSVSTDLDNADGERLTAKFEKHLDMPASWVSKIVLAHSDFERRYVDCHKTLRFRKCSVELLAPYSDNAGLETRVTHFADYECTEVLTVREAFAHRADLLYFVATEAQAVHQRFRQGRDDALREYWFQAVERGFPTELRFDFYAHSREEGLFKLIKDDFSMTEEFVDREDFLCHRQVTYAESSASEKPILKITERYRRNREKPVSEDPAQVEYDLEEGKVRIVYQYGEERISAGTRELSLTEMKQTAAYDPTPSAPAPRPLALYRWLQEWARGAEAAQRSVRQREQMVQEMLMKRARQTAEPELIISPFDEERNQTAKDRYKERDRKREEEAERDLSLAVDLLAPYLAALPSAPSTDATLPADDARRVYNKCLQDWKTLLLTRATDIQRQFDQVCHGMKESLQTWSEDLPAGKDPRLCRLHCLKVRLMRHKELAPQRYLALDACLRADSRLARAFH